MPAALSNPFMSVVMVEAGAEAPANRGIPFPTPDLAPLLMAADGWAIPRPMPIPPLGPIFIFVLLIPPMFVPPNVAAAARPPG